MRIRYTADRPNRRRGLVCSVSGPQRDARPALAWTEARAELSQFLTALSQPRLRTGTTATATLRARQIARLIAIDPDHHLTCAEAMVPLYFTNTTNFSFLYGKSLLPASFRVLPTNAEMKQFETVQWVEPCLTKCVTFANGEAVISAFGTGGWERGPLPLAHSSSFSDTTARISAVWQALALKFAFDPTNPL